MATTVLRITDVYSYSTTAVAPASSTSTPPIPAGFKVSNNITTTAGDITGDGFGEMQSGISASQELQAQFASLLETPSTFGLLVTIEKEKLIPVTTLPSKSSSFSDNLTSLEPHIKPDVALYSILRRYDDAPQFLAVTYVPDSAPVRQKMLFASTRLTLVRELGTEHFRETILTTEADEMTEDGFKKHDAHAELAAPLTEEERTLGEVKLAEQVAGSGTGVREIHLSQHMKMPVAQDVMTALEELKNDGGRVVAMLKINPETEIVELVPESPRPSNITELVKEIAVDEPRFTLFRYKHTYNGEEHSPVLFFFTSPPMTGHKALKYRMMYPLMKRTVLKVGEGEVGLDLSKRFEVEEPNEITESSVMEELHPKPTARQGFSRPKRPGR